MDLYQRLRAAQHGGGAPKPVRKRPMLDLPPADGWERLAAGVYRRTTDASETQGVWGSISSVLGPLAKPQSAPLFFDLETTGLSGGAGNVAFLAGFGRFSGEREARVSCTVTQYFLSDFGAEPEFIEAVDGELRAFPDQVIVSYNGASFDVPLIRSRFLMTKKEFPTLEHVDLLPFARRLWRNLVSDCRLGTIEERILGLHRDEDVPGSLAPYRYREFHRSGETWPLREVVSHHRYDIETLAVLLERVDEVLCAPPEQTEWQKVDPDGLISLFMTRGTRQDHKKACSVASSLTYNADFRARRRTRWGAVARFYGATLRRAARSGNGDFCEARSVAQSLWEERLLFDDGVALAKIEEHHIGDLSSALRVCRQAMEFPGLSVRALSRLDRRRSRIIAKLKKLAADSHQ